MSTRDAWIWEVACAVALAYEYVSGGCETEELLLDFSLRNLTTSPDFPDEDAPDIDLSDERQSLIDETKRLVRYVAELRDFVLLPPDFDPDAEPGPLRRRRTQPRRPPPRLVVLPGGAR